MVWYAYGLGFGIMLAMVYVFYLYPFVMGRVVSTYLLLLFRNPARNEIRERFVAAIKLRSMRTRIDQYLYLTVFRPKLLLSSSPSEEANLRRWLRSFYEVPVSYKNWADQWERDHV